MRFMVDSSRLPADVYSARCPTRQMLDRLANKWTVLVVDALATGIMRYSELHRRIEGVSQKMLTQTLRELETDGFVKRTVTPTTPPRVDYELTDLGISLQAPISAIRTWTEEHINDVERARVRVAEDRTTIGLR